MDSSLWGFSKREAEGGPSVCRACTNTLPVNKDLKSNFSRRQLHGRVDPAGGGSMHGDRVRAAEPRGGRTAFHAATGGAQRSIMVVAFSDRALEGRARRVLTLH